MKWFAWLKKPDPDAAVGNFTPRLMLVWENAREEALRLKDGFVGTEHLLLALINSEGTVPSTILKRIGINANDVTTEVRKAREGKPNNENSENLPCTPRVKMVLALAVRRAKAMGHHFITTEHLLLGILEDSEKNGGGLAAKILRIFKPELKEIHDEVIRELTVTSRHEKDK